MAKRLQVTLQYPEYREVQRAARSRQMTIAQWVRQALESARRCQTQASVQKKLQAVQQAAKHEFPVGDIGDMLSEIERGYLRDRSAMQGSE